MTLLEHLADWITTRQRNWSDVAIERAEHAIADTIAAIVAGSTDPVTNAVGSTFQAYEADGADQATVIGTPRKLPSPWAAMVNGTAAHVLELDDNFYPALTHASAVLLPALLAAAEEANASGSELIDAYIVGLELHALLGRGVNRSHYFAGWHPTATIGCIGTAGACARLLNLDKQQTIGAMSTAVSMAAGNKAQFGTPAKSFQAGNAAANAALAAKLASNGLTGNPNVLEDPQGFLALYGGPAPRGWEEPLKKLDNPLAIEEFGLAPKRHACCGSAHNTLDCILDLKAEHGFTADDVESIDVLIGAANRKNLKFDNPQDEFEARFSLPYNVALVLLYGQVTLKDFTDKAVFRPEVRDLLELTHISARTFEEEPLDPDIRPAHVVGIKLKDGRQLHAERVYAKGIIQDPFTDAERSQKIRACCEPVLSDRNYQALTEKLNRVHALTSVRDLTATLNQHG